MKVFAIDRDPITLATIAFILEREGMEAQYCINTDPYLYDKLVGFLPDVIVLDLDVLDLKGIPVVKELKDIKEIENLPIIALSNSIEVEDKILNLYDDFSYYLEKPLDKEFFLAVVNRYGNIGNLINLCNKSIEEVKSV